MDTVIDLSKFQTGVNFQKVKAAGVDGVIVKATEGTGSVSPAWTTMQYPGKAKAVGLPVGSYHFALPTSNPTAEAQHYVSVTGTPESGSLGGWYDIEGAGWTASRGRAAAAAFTAEYHRLTGLWPGIYCSASFWTSVLGSGAGLNAAVKARLWVAHYGVAAGHPAVAGWKLHQYTSTGTIPGVGGGCDVSVAAGPLSQLLIGASAVGSKWYRPFGLDSTVWIPGRAPVYALEKRPYPSSTVPKTADMRLVPADRCPDSRTGITQDWADFLHDLFAAIPWDARPGATWAAHHGIVRGDPYGAEHIHALDKWGQLHGGLTRNNWATLWASLLGMIKR